MRITLTDGLRRYVRDQIERGLYTDASEVIREALRLKIVADDREAAKLEALQAALDEADADLRADRFDVYHDGYLDDLGATAQDHAAE